MPLSQTEILQRYARLVVECGWGGTAGIAGKPVHVQHSVEAYPLLLAIAEEAYRHGAIRVDYTTWSPPLDALHVTYATDASLTDVPSTWADRWNDLVDVRGATLRIEGVDDPFALARCPSDRVNRFEAARIVARQHFYTEGLGKNTTPWCLIPFATLDWGRLVFGDSPDARDRLEAVLIQVLGLANDDYIERWWARGERIARRSRLLDAAGIESLHVAGPSTDLTVGLHPLARFGGGMHNGNDVRFFANLPTFENYTTPDRRRTRGVVSMTRPVLINGQSVEGLHVEFAEGRVVGFRAIAGEDAFRAMVDTDEGASFLGEVALVGIDDSPIYSTGLVFQNILLDENAACHIAFGRAYIDRLEGGTAMSREDLDAAGCNDSKVHRDCMISDEHTSVTGVCRDGSRRPIIEGGMWTGDFRL
ncbi:MAG: aminopeptidase [Vicinamibacterales bacterium]